MISGMKNPELPAIRWWTCLLGHQWTQWRETTEYTVSRRSMFPLTTPPENQVIQIRDCRRCGKREWRGM